MESSRCQLPRESRQGRTVLATILPSHREPHPYNDHAEYNALHIKFTKRSKRKGRARSHNDWGYLFKSVSYYGRSVPLRKNLPPVTICNEPSYETNRWLIGSLKTLNR